MTTFWLSIIFTVGILGATFAQSSRKGTEVKIIMSINAPTDTTFDYIVPVDLSHIFKRYKKLPGITNTSIKEGWTKPGLVRTIYFEDGSTSQETLLTVIPHSSFSYKVEKFTSALRHLGKRIDGVWYFYNIGNGQTQIEWTYKIVPKNFLAKAIIQVFLLKDIEALLTKALITLKNDLEKRPQNILSNGK